MMRDINRFRSVYYTVVSFALFILLWNMLPGNLFSRISHNLTDFSVESGFVILFISLALKGFRNIFTVIILASTGIMILLSIYHNNIVVAFVCYSLAFPIITADAVYSQANYKNKIILFLISIILFSLIVTLLNYNGNSNESNSNIENKNQENAYQTAKSMRNSTTENNGTADEKWSDPLKNKERASQIPRYRSDSTLEKADNLKSRDSLSKENYDLKDSVREKEKTKIKDEISYFLINWKNAWESRDIRQFKTFYSSDYVYTDENDIGYKYTERMMSLDKSFKEIKYLNITILDIEYVFDDEYPNEVEVKFKQSYTSKTHSDYGITKLRIFKGKSTKNKWKIYREEFKVIQSAKEYKPVQKEDSAFYSKIYEIIIIIVVILVIIGIIKKIFK